MKRFYAVSNDFEMRFFIMAEIKFIAVLDELVDEIIANNVEVKTNFGLQVKILEHSSNRLKIQLEDGKEMVIALYNQSANFCFFEKYKVKSVKIMDTYNAAKEIFEDDKIAEAADKEAERLTTIISSVSTHHSPRTGRRSVGVTYAGFNQEDFMDFILSQISPLTQREYVESSARIYNREICKILSSGVSFSQLSADIDQYIFDYTNEKGCMKAENEAHHANPGCALVLLKKYIEKP